MRRKDREITDINEILNMIDKTKILHLGLFDKGYPYIVPLHYGYVYERVFDINEKMTSSVEVIKISMEDFTMKKIMEKEK